MIKIIFSFLACLLPLSVHSEVMDKEPSLQLNFIWGIGGAIIIFLSARYRPKFLPLISCLPLFYFYALLEEINDPYVGPDILKEAGKFYIYSGYGLSFAVLMSIPVGLLLRWHNKP